MIIYYLSKLNILEKLKNVIARRERPDEAIQDKYWLRSSSNLRELSRSNIHSGLRHPLSRVRDDDFYVLSLNQKLVSCVF